MNNTLTHTHTHNLEQGIHYDSVLTLLILHFGICSSFFFTFVLVLLADVPVVIHPIYFDVIRIVWRHYRDEKQKRKKNCLEKGRHLVFIFIIIEKLYIKQAMNKIITFSISRDTLDNVLYSFFSRCIPLHAVFLYAFLLFFILFFLLLFLFCFVFFLSFVCH